MPAGTDRERPAVLITGATGALGDAVIARFEPGWSIRTLSRRPPPAAARASSHPHVAAEIDDVGALRGAMHGVDVVVHMAALLHVFEPERSLESEYTRVNVGGSVAVVRAALDEAVKRVVALSSIAVYGPATGMLDEHSTPVPDTPYGRTKLAAERAVLTAVDSQGRQIGCVLRLAAVYGPSVKGNYERLVRALARRRFVAIGSGANARTLIFEDDAADAVFLAATTAQAAGELLNATDGKIHTVAEIIDAICVSLERGRPALSLPVPLARTAAKAAGPLFRLLGKRSPMTVATIDKYTENVAVSGERIRRVLGFEPKWTLARGWARTVEVLRSEGRL